MLQKAALTARTESPCWLASAPNADKNNKRARTLLNSDFNRFYFGEP
jgi:hypothetical protein